MRLTIAISVLLLFALQVNSQVQQEWVRYYDYSIDDRGGPGKTDFNGNIVVTGQKYSPYSQADIILVKYNNDGELLWNRIYNGPANSTDLITSMVIDDSNNIYITGSSVGIGTSYDIVTLKYNQYGILQWENRYNSSGSNSDLAGSISIDNSNNIYITGKTELGSQDYRVVTIKYNRDGQELMNFTFQAHSSSQYCMSNVDYEYNIYIVYTDNSQGTGEDMWIRKYNNAGQNNWTKFYNGTGNFIDYASSLLIDSSDNTYVGGITNSGGCIIDYFLIKYDSLGNQQFLKKINFNTGCLYASCIILLDNQNNIFLVGSGTNPPSFLAVKINSIGETLWQRKYNENDYNHFYSDAKLDIQNNIYITGIIWESNENAFDIATIKYGFNGDLIWHISYNGLASLNDGSTSISLYSDGIFINGSGYYSINNSDLLVIKYTQPIGIQPISSEIPDKFSLSQNYPNPFNPNTRIRFALPPSPHGEGLGVRVTVYDILGKEIRTLVNGKLNPGTYEVEFDGTEFPSGVYFYKLITNDFLETKKMVLIK